MFHLSPTDGIPIQKYNSHLCYSEHSRLERLVKQKCTNIRQMVKTISLSHNKINSRTANDLKAARSFPRLSVTVFWHMSGQREASGVSPKDLMPSRQTRTPHNRISDLWNRSAFSCYSRDRLLWPLWVPCQSCEWPAWVTYTSPRVSHCHVARKWHINAANPAAAVVTRMTVRRTSSWTHAGSGTLAQMLIRILQYLNVTSWWLWLFHTASGSTDVSLLFIFLFFW